MALPKDLKKDMEGEAGSEKLPVPNVVPAERTSAPVEPKRAAETEPVPNPAPKSTSAPSVDGAVLAKINQRLASLEMTLTELQDDFDTYTARAFNYGPIFTKLEAVQTDLEKLLTAKPDQDEPETEAPNRLEELIQKVLEKQESNDRQLVRYLRENANFQVQVRQQMQGDLDELREQQSGTLFNPMLKEIASMYADYQMLLEDESMSQKTRKNLLALFGQMEDLLLDYDAEVCASKVGEERPKHRCRIITQIPTGDKSKHNTIARSRKPGVMRGRLVLAHEFVDVYVYDPNLDQELNDQNADQTPIDEEQVQDTQQTAPGGSGENEIPAEVIPGEDAPAEENPTEETPDVETPAEETPAGETPTEEPAAEKVPAEEPSDEEVPTKEVPTEEVPAEEVPAEEPSANEAPAEEPTVEQNKKHSFLDRFKKK